MQSMNLPEQSGRKTFQSNKKQRVKAHNNDSVDMSDSDEDEYNNTGTIIILVVFSYVCLSVCLSVVSIQQETKSNFAHNGN